MPNNPAPPARIHYRNHALVHLARTLLNRVHVARELEKGLAVWTAVAHEFLSRSEDAADHAGAEMAESGCGVV